VRGLAHYGGPHEGHTRGPPGMGEDQSLWSPSGAAGVGRTRHPRGRLCARAFTPLGVVHEVHQGTGFQLEGRYSMVLSESRPALHAVIERTEDSCSGGVEAQAAMAARRYEGMISVMLSGCRLSRGGEQHNCKNKG